ncbi:MAG: DnaJ domain-containing protein [archaeon]
MTKVQIRGIDYEVSYARDSFDRRALQCKNKLIMILKDLGIAEDDIEIPLEPVAIKKNSASASWFVDGHHMFFSTQAADRYIDNLYIISKVIESKINALLNEELPVDEFMSFFAEETEIKADRKIARETLGLHEDTMDITVVNKRYKELAKEHHPDIEGGNPEKFKEINKAHKILKRELE